VFTQSGSIEAVCGRRACRNTVTDENSKAQLEARREQLRRKLESAPDGNNPKKNTKLRAKQTSDEL
jgi:hypothetical protein